VGDGHDALREPLDQRQLDLPVNDN
jgi:hypothetical protein